MRLLDRQCVKHNRLLRLEERYSHKHEPLHAKLRLNFLKSASLIMGPRAERSLGPRHRGTAGQGLALTPFVLEKRHFLRTLLAEKWHGYLVRTVVRLRRK